MDSSLLAKKDSLSFLLKPPHFNIRQLEQLKEVSLSLGLKPYYFSLLEMSSFSTESFDTYEKNRMLILDDLFAFYALRRDDKLYELLDHFSVVWCLDYVLYPNDLEDISRGFSTVVVYKRYYLHKNILIPRNRGAAQLLKQRNAHSRSRHWVLDSRYSKPLRSYLAFQNPGQYVYCDDIDCGFFQKLFSWGRTKWQILFSFQRV